MAPRINRDCWADGEPCEKDAANARTVMQRAAARDGVRLRVVSGFRTMAEEPYLQGCYVDRNCNNGNLAARLGYSHGGAALSGAVVAAALPGDHLRAVGALEREVGTLKPAAVAVKRVGTPRWSTVTPVKRAVIACWTTVIAGWSTRSRDLCTRVAVKRPVSPHLWTAFRHLWTAPAVKRAF